MWKRCKKEGRHQRGSEGEEVFKARAFFYVSLSELRVYFDQTRVCDEQETIRGFFSLKVSFVSVEFFFSQWWNKSLVDLARVTQQLLLVKQSDFVL